MGARQSGSGDKSSRRSQQNAAGAPLSQYVCERIRQLRKRRNWTLEKLARESGVSRSMLSQVERGAANPTLSVAFRIVQALGVSLAELVEGATAERKMEVIRRDDARAIYRDDSVCRIRTLSPLNLEKDVEFYEVTLKPGQEMASAPHFRGTREFLTVQSGAITVVSGREEAMLKKGDSVQYPADVEHAIINHGHRPATFFLVDIYRQ